jgi:murein DD-endopeptidase MepM/ murein hydrolase activator NlpD
MEKSVKRKGKKGLQSAVIAAVFLFTLMQPQLLFASSITDQINQKNSESDSLQSSISQIQGDIKQKQSQAASLANQVAIFDDEIKKNQLQVDKKKADISSTNLQIQQTQASITDAQAQIAHQKNVLAEYIRTLNYSDDVSSVQLLFSDHSFSDILNNMQNIETVQGSVKDSLDTIKVLESQLNFKNQELQTTKTNLEKQKKDLDFKVSELKGSQQEKQELLDVTKNDEAEFQKKLAEAKSDYNQKESEIAALERKLREDNTHYGTSQPYTSGFVWPLPVGMGIITCSFHCAGYFSGMTHTGTDLGAPKGTPIYSATTGTVVHAGWGKSHGGYGFYAAIQSGNLLLIYGHMLEGSIPVSVGQNITTGTRIGSVGLTGMTTGYHLHFEVRSNGVPVNAMNYY